MMERKSEFWWASIHGADPEPVEKTEHDGRPCVYTLGCADPFYLDEKPCPLLFVTNAPRPKHPDIQAAEDAARRAESLRQSVAAYRRGTGRNPIDFTHGWRGPR